VRNLDCSDFFESSAGAHEVGLSIWRLLKRHNFYRLDLVEGEALAFSRTRANRYKSKPVARTNLDGECHRWVCVPKT
jgi:hypothetical protein